MITLISPVEAAPETWWNADWHFRKPITIDPNQVATNLPNFPVLIDITDNDLANKAQINAGDIVFTDDADTKLNHEIEFYDSNTGHLTAWVNLPLLSVTTDTTLYLYYGNPTCENQQNPTAVWNSNYRMVQHLNENSGTHYDSTPNGNNGSPYGGLAQDATGKIDGADAFDGTNDYIEIPHSNSITGFTESFSASVWFKIEDVAKRQSILHKYDTTNDQRGWLIEYRTDVGRAIALLASPDGVNYDWWYISFNPTAGEWYYLAVVWQANSVPLFYINGQLVPTIRSGTIPVIYNNNLAPLHIGKSTYSYVREFKGILDEIRLSNTARSANWILTSYNNQKDPHTFYSIGSEETQDGSPAILNETPQNGATDVYTNPTLSVHAIDLDGDYLTIIFRTNATGTWQDIGSYINVESGTYTLIPTTMNQLGTRYHWSVCATDGISWTNRTFTFTTTSIILSPKWTVNLPTGVSGVLTADINGNGAEEVIHAGKGQITVLNGADSSIIWTVQDSNIGDWCQPQMADLNKDGILEIIVPLDTPAGILVLHSNNGSTYWRRTGLGGHLYSSPVVADIDGSGYPTIFAVSTDINTATLAGHVTSINNFGQILHQTFAWRACAGGLSIADTDGDGEFELYMGDRHMYYSDAGYGRGVRSFWAKNLTVRWERPDILCSSHIPMLADVTGDGILDVIVGDQSSPTGIAVLNSRDGSTIRANLNNHLPIHYQSSIYDIDGDGNLEIIVADGEHDYDGTDYHDIVVFDLVEWKVDARMTVGKSLYGPIIADVTGDGFMDIIAVSYNGIHIFDRTYTLLDEITGLSGRLNYAVVQDIDGDGYNEIVVTNKFNSQVYAFDTPARSPTPRARSEVQFYSERRCGVQEYVPPPGSFEPLISNPSPSDGEMDVPIALSQLSFTLTDFQQDLMTFTVTTTPDIGSGSGTNVGNGRYTVEVNDLDYGTSYAWTVSVTDGAEWTTETFTFTTETMPEWWNTDWQYRKTITIDPSQVTEDQTDFPIVIDIVDSDLIGRVQPEGQDIVFIDTDTNKLSHEIEHYDNSDGHLVAWVRIPYLSSTSFTTIYMYYGNSAAPNQEDPAAVWDTSYKVVLHLSEMHECRMWGMVSDSLPHDVVQSHLITDQDSLRELSYGNQDGWGLAWYAGADPEIRRGDDPAYSDPEFDAAANDMADSGATIGVGHVRAASSGTPSDIPNPHPFMREKGGRWWAFTHNGYISKPAVKALINSIDPDYLSENPPTVGDWDIENSYVDSDLYMVYVLLCIEQSNWDVLTGISMAASSVPSGSGNFLLTDGTTIWGFVNGQSLSYYYQSASPTYSVVASQPPDPYQSGWVSLSNYNLVILSKNNAPTVISDIRQYNLLVDATFDASTNSTALRTDGTGQDWYESRSDVPALLYLDEANVGGNTGKKAGFTADSDGNAYVTQEFGAPQTGTFSVQWNIYVDSILDISQTDRAGWMMIGDNFDTSQASRLTPNNPPLERFVYMAFAHEGGATEGTMDLVAKTAGEDFDEHTIIASGLNLKQWYTIKVICDVAAKSYDVFVDDVFMDTFVSDFARGSVTHISFAQWNDGAGAFYVDNVYAPAPSASYTLDVTIDGSGTVLKNPDSPEYYEGTDVTLTAVSDPGYAFEGWSGDYVGSENPLTITMDSDKEITAHFATESYTLLVNVIGDGSVSIDPDLPTYNYGDLVTLAATANAGWKFALWSGDLSGDANPATVIMTGNKVVTATFIPEDDPICKDSTSYGNIGILYGDVTQGAAGKIDGAYAFDGINDYIEIAHSSTLTGYTEAFTASFWLKLEDTTRRQAILNKYDTAGNQRGWLIEYRTDVGRAIALLASPDGVNYDWWYISFNPTAGTWYYITVVWESGVIPRFYVDGAQVATVRTGTIASIFDNAGAPLDIGRCTYAAGRYLDGVLDEVRISNPARSADYILTSYNNQKNPTSFIQMGEEESLPSAPMISDPNPENGATNVPVSLSELRFNLTDYQNDFMDYTVVTFPDIGTGSGTHVPAGTYSIPVTGLEYDTTYSWQVKVTDGTEETTVAYIFTTGPHVQQLLVDSTFDASVDSADLRDDGAGQDWYESRNDIPAILYLDETDVEGNAGKKAGFLENDDDNAYLTQEFSSPQTGVFTAEWDIYIDTIVRGSDDQYKAGIMMIGDNHVTSPSNYATPNYPPDERFVYMAFYKPGGGSTGTMSLSAISPSTTIATNLNLDQWYNIKVVVDFPAGTYDVYVDGVFKTTVPANAVPASLTHISFAQWDDGAGAFYVDNVSAYVEVTGNQAPVIDSYSPTTDPTIAEGESQEFTVTYHDPEGDDTSVQWYLDDLPTVTEDIYTFEAAVGSAGTYEVNVTVTDTGGGKTSKVWMLTVYGTLLVDSTFDASADSDELRANGAGQDWYESRNDAAPGPLLLSLDENNVEGNAGNKAGFTGSTANPGGNAYMSQEFSSAQTGTFSVQWDIYVDSIDDAYDMSGFVFIGDNSAGDLNTDGSDKGPNSATNERFMRLECYKSPGGTEGTMVLRIRQSNPSATTTIATLNLDQWYTIKVVCNVESDTILVYVDGTEYGPYRAHTNKISVTHISFATWNDGAGAFYVDNVYSPPVDNYKLTVTVEGEGTVDVTPGESTYLAGSLVTLIPTAGEGYVFDHWELDGVPAGSEDPYTVTMDTDHTVTAAFTAEGNVAPEISGPEPSDLATGVPVSTALLNFTVSDADGDLMDYYLLTVPDVGSGSALGVSDGTYSLTVSGLEYSTTYTWWVNVTDGTDWTNSSFTFTTEDEQVPLLVDSTFDACTDDADLRDDNEGQDWYDSRDQAPTLLYLDESNVGGNAGKKAGFTASTSGNVYLSQEFASPQTGTFTVQWDIYVDSIIDISGTDAAGWMMIGDNSNPSSPGPNYPTAERFVYMAFYKEGGGESGTMELFCRQRGTDTRTTIATLNLDQWYTIRVVVDVAAGVYDVYVDGALMGTYTSRNAKTSVTHISFAQWDDGAGAFYVDNVFSPPTDRYKLTVTVVGEGSVDVDPAESSYPFDSVVSLTPTAGTGYVLDHWELDTVPDGSDIPYIVTMDSDHTVTAVFIAEVTYTITASAGVGGSIDPVGEVVVAEGADQLFTITPHSGYEIADVLVDSVSVGAVSTYTFEDVAADYTIAASFSLLPPLLVDSTFDASSSSDYLRTDSEGQDWYESRNAVPSTMLYLDETNIGGNTGKKAGFAGSTAQNAYMSQEFSKAQTGTFSVQWDIYVDSITDYGSTDASGWMFIGDNSAGDLEGGFDKGPNSATNERFMNMYFYKSGGGTEGTMQLRIRQSNPSATTTIATLNLDQWYTIKVVCNVEADTILVYVDGVEYGPYRAYTVKTSVTHISFATWNDGPGVFYVDNVYSPPVDTYKLSVVVVGDGTVDVNPGESSYVAGSEVLLTPTADEGYMFDRWELDGTPDGSEVPYTVTMDSDHTVTAVFTAEGNVAPEISGAEPADAATGVSVSTSLLNFTVSDADGDLMDIYLSTVPDVGSGSALGVSDGTYSLTVSGLEYSTTYTWWVNVTDGTDWTNSSFTFTTEDEQVPLLVDSQFDESTSSTDLRDNTEGQDWYESRGQDPALLYLDETDVGGNTGKKAGFTANSTTNAYLTQEFGEAQTGTFAVEWDIYVDEILNIEGNPDRAGWMLIGDDTTAGNGPNAYNDERFVYMAFAKPGGGTDGTMDLVARDRNDGWTAFTTVATGLNLDQWYTIKVVCDLNADTYDIYVDGVYQATVTSRIAKTSVTHISFAQWDDGAGTFYIDNVYAQGSS
jgi:predicted glutamine amidotransferase